MTDYNTVAQAIINVFASFGSISAPLIAAAWVRDNPRHGWRDFYVRFLLTSFFPY